MVAVSTISWEEVASPGFTDPARQAFRAAVAQIAATASAKLPESNGRIESAVKLVLASDVQLGPDGTATIVGSASDAQQSYEVRPGFCSCTDFTHAPHGGLCKHRLAAAILRRATTLLATGKAPEGDVEPLEAPPAAEPEPSSTIPPQYIVVIQGKPFVRYAGLLQMAHERGLVTLTAAWLFNDAELSLAQAIATFADGRSFVEAGDASPANTNKKVAVHFRRVALTRAKARCLRDALGVDMVSLEELAE